MKNTVASWSRLFKPLQGVTLAIFWEPRDEPGQRVHQPGQYLIITSSNLILNHGSDLILDEWD